MGLLFLEGRGGVRLRDLRFEAFHVRGSQAWILGDFGFRLLGSTGFRL